MRISYIHYLYGDDTALQHVQSFVAAARNLGHDVTVHAMNLAPTGTARTGRLRVRQWLKNKVSRSLHEPKELLWNLRYVRRELRIVRAEKPDVLVVRDHHLTCAEAIVRTIARVPLVLEVNAPGADQSRRYLDQYRHVPLAGGLTERWRMRAADTIVVVSEALRQHLIEAYAIAAERIVTNPNGADCERFHPDVDATPIRRRHGFGSDVVIGFVGSLHPWRGPELLRAVIDATCRSGVRFLLVGDGPGWDGLRDWLAGRPYRNRVVVTGSIRHADVPAYLAAMDIAFIPDSAFYMSPLKLFEYMASARAVVAPQCGALEEIIQSGIHGVLFAPQSAAAAVEAIESLVANATLRHELGRNARELAIARFTWAHNAGRVIEACRTVIRTVPVAAVSLPVRS